MNSRQRPIGVSIVAWLLVVGSGISVLYTPLSLSNPITQRLIQSADVSPAVVVFLGMLTGIMNIIAGIAMLKGRRWGRQLYLFATPAILLISFVLYGAKFLAINFVSGGVYAVYLLLLTRRDATEYFSAAAVTASPRPGLQATPPGPQTAPQIQADSSGKRVLSVLLMIPGAIMLNVLSMMILPLSDNFLAVLIATGIIGIIACAFIVPAVFLWGRKRWAAILGTLLTAVGGMNLMMSLLIFQVSSMGELHDQFSKLDPATLEKMTRGSLIFGLAAVVIGVLLIILQRENDKEAKPKVVTP